MSDIKIYFKKQKQKNRIIEPYEQMIDCLILANINKTLNKA